MKRVLWMFVGALMAAAMVPAWASAAEVVGKVIAVKGGATVARAGGSAKPLKVDDPMYLGDVVTTGADGKVKLLMKDESVLTLGRKARIELRQYMVDSGKGKRNTIIGHTAGILRFLVQKAFSAAGSKFEVHTPTAVAGVRGTHGLTNVVSDDESLVVCLDGDPGDMYCNNEHGSQDLSTGQGSSVGKGAGPSGPQDMSGQIGDMVNDTTMGDNNDAQGAEGEDSGDYDQGDMDDVGGDTGDTGDTGDAGEDGGEEYVAPGESIPSGGGGGGGEEVSPNQ